MSDSGSTPPGRREAARHLLHPHQLKDSLTLSPQPSLRNSTLAGLQAAVTVAIALPIFYLSPWQHLIGFASLGALVALFGRFAPSRKRLRILFLCGLWQVLAVFTMSAAAWLLSWYKGVVDKSGSGQAREPSAGAS